MRFLTAEVPDPLILFESRDVLALIAQQASDHVSKKIAFVVELGGGVCCSHFSSFSKYSKISDEYPISQNFYFIYVFHVDQGYSIQVAAITVLLICRKITR
jgi:hypothetical protein